MTTVYGNLPKSQTDAETIEEMIDRKISEHEASPTAHMGTGESIDVHRKTDIIDHPANSIYADKFTTSETIVKQQYTSDTLEDSQGTHLFDSNINSRLIGDNYPALSYYFARRYTPNIIPEILGTNAQFQGLYRINVETGTGTKARVGIGSSTDFENPYGLFIEKNDTGYRLYINQAGHEEYSSYITYNNNRFFVFRIEYTKGENITRFYFNGNKIHEVDYLYEEEITNYYIETQIKINSSDDVVVIEALNEEWARGL